jgi:hypothetical protein
MIKLKIANDSLINVNQKLKEEHKKELKEYEE